MMWITIEEQAKAIERWKADNGVTGRDYVPLNSGARRTDSKRKLLRLIEKAAIERGAESPFFAKH